MSRGHGRRDRPERACVCAPIACAFALVQPAVTRTVGTHILCLWYHSSVTLRKAWWGGGRRHPKAIREIRSRRLAFGIWFFQPRGLVGPRTQCMPRSLGSQGNSPSLHLHGTRHRK
jgi:hypothetical protein